jgi:hypothetical protein
MSPGVRTAFLSSSSPKLHLPNRMSIGRFTVACWFTGLRQANSLGHSRWIEVMSASAARTGWNAGGLVTSRLGGGEFEPALAPDHSERGEAFCFRISLRPTPIVVAVTSVLRSRPFGE